MKLKLVHYNNAKALGCKQDDVWFIIKRPDNLSYRNHESFVIWDTKRKMPAECICPAVSAYSNLDAAKLDFNEIEYYYRNNGGFTTIKEVTI